MDLKILSDRTRFLESVIVKLGSFPIDFMESMAGIQSSRGTSELHSAAGVLLLLHFRKKRPDEEDQQGDFCFHLIKRSASVAQPGDLSCPGGMLHPHLDGLLRVLLVKGLVPVLKGYPESFIRKENEDPFKTITLFLTNGLRESWEEIGLSPFNVRFLGPLSCHSLILFRRTIFPLVCLVNKEPLYRPNREVDRVVEIPLASFFRDDNYAHYLIDRAGSLKDSDQVSWQFPCFRHQEEGRAPEILWGATFNIILRFLEILFDFKLPEIPSGRVIRRTLHQSYLTGHK